MRISSVTFTAAEITGGQLVRKNAFIDVSASGGIVNGVQQIDVIRKYPMAISVYNSTGGAVEIALLANEIEESEFIITPANYFFVLPNRINPVPSPTSYIKFNIVTSVHISHAN
jgi:hypothetical protein